MNLGELRTLVRTRLGIPDLGSKGAKRLDEMINQALRFVTPFLPEAILRHQYRLRLEPAWTVGTLSGVADDAYALEVIGGTGYSFPSRHEIQARTLEVQLPVEGANIGAQPRYFVSVVRDFVVKVEVGGSTRYFFILDQPFYDTSLTGLAWRVYTDAYPIPLRAVDIQTVQLSPESQLLPLAYAESHSGLLALRRARGWRSGGRVQAYADGDAQQLQQPRQAPTTSVAQEPAPGERWGYDAGGTQHGSAFVGHQYGPAGQFEYCYCLGWGRRKTPQDLHAGDFGDNVGPVGAPGELRIGQPFWLSGPSKSTGPVSTTWGGAAIRISSADMSYVWGYNARSGTISRGYSGLSKWWFRRRLTTAPSPAGGSPFDAIEADGVWYLWRITPADETTTWDRGDSDPPDRNFELPRHYGHRAVRFDLTAPNIEDVLLEYHRKPEMLSDDQDVVPIPEEHIDVLVYGVKAQQAERDGDARAVGIAAAQQREALDALRTARTRDSFLNVEFGRVTVGSSTPGLWPWPNPPTVM